jgi:hypothetical protein
MLREIPDPGGERRRRRGRYLGQDNQIIITVDRG